MIGDGAVCPVTGGEVMLVGCVWEVGGEGMPRGLLALTVDASVCPALRCFVVEFSTALRSGREGEIRLNMVECLSSDTEIIRSGVLINAAAACRLLRRLSVEYFRVLQVRLV